MPVLLFVIGIASLWHSLTDAVSSIDHHAQSITSDIHSAANGPLLLPELKIHTKHRPVRGVKPDLYLYDS